jgi:hypothetical protein
MNLLTVLAVMVLNFTHLLEFRPAEADVPPVTYAFTAPLPQDTSRNQHSGTSRIHHRSGSNATEITYRGRIEFTEDERDIRSISPGGFFKFSKTTFGNTRTIHIESSSDGSLSRAYYVGRKEESYEPEGRKWLADVLPEIIATSGIGAEDRVKRIYAKEGINGVMKAVARLESDYTKAIYYGYLLEQPNLKDSELRHLLGQIRTTVSSDYEKAKLLRRVNHTYLQNEALSQEYLATVGSISSDYEKSQVLKHILRNTRLTEANTELVMQTVSNISSDYEKSQVIKTLLKDNTLNEVSTGQLLKAINSISSDYERAQTLKQMLTQGNLSSANFRATLAATSGISSDYEKTGVIKNLISRNPQRASEYLPDLLKLVNTISSDYERGQAYSLMLDKLKFSEEQYAQVLAGISAIASDHEKANQLVKLSKTLPRNNTTVMDAYRKAAKTLSSDYEYRRAISALE